MRIGELHDLQNLRAPEPAETDAFTIRSDPEPWGVAVAARTTLCQPCLPGPSSAPPAGGAVRPPLAPRPAAAVLFAASPGPASRRHALAPGPVDS
jgi:hypothetical protein